MGLRSTASEYGSLAHCGIYLAVFVQLVSGPIIVAALLVVHVIGAIYNHVVLGNNVLRRMTTGLQQDG